MKRKTRGEIVMAWLQEAVLFLGDMVSLIALPMITSIIFLFNHLVFRTSRVKPKGRQSVRVGKLP